MSFFLQPGPWWSHSLLDFQRTWKLLIRVWMSLGQGSCLIRTQSALADASFSAISILLSFLDLSPCFLFPFMSLRIKCFWEGVRAFLSAEKHMSLLPSYISSLPVTSLWASSARGNPIAAGPTSEFLPEAVYKGNPKEGSLKLFIDIC